MKRTGPAHFSDGAGRGNLRLNLLNTSARNRSPDMFARRCDVQKFHGAAWERRRISLRRGPPASADVLK